MHRLARSPDADVHRRQLEVEAQGHYEGREIQPYQRRAEFDGRTTSSQDYRQWELPVGQQRCEFDTD
jgi:hypothetical protein